MFSWYFSTSVKKNPCKARISKSSCVFPQSLHVSLANSSCELCTAKGGKAPSTVICLGGGGRGDGNTFKNPKGGKPLLAKAILSMLARQAVQRSSALVPPRHVPCHFHFNQSAQDGCWFILRDGPLGAKVKAWGELLLHQCSTPHQTQGGEARLRQQIEFKIPASLLKKQTSTPLQKNQKSKKQTKILLWK